jgi:hypothetical protein
MKRVIIAVYVLLMILACQSIMAAEVRRTHRYIRSIAMGDAFTAVADSEETIAHNPAGLLHKNVEWSVNLPFLGVGFNDIVKNWNNAETERDFSDTSTLEDLPGKRIYTETQISLMPSLYIPNKGIYTGFDADIWLEIIFPPQVIIPTVSIDAVVQGTYDYAMAFEIWGLNIGANLKYVNRKGIVADLDLISISAYLEDEDIQGLIDEYAADQPEPKLVLDLGLLYRFDHPWNFRIGLSSLDMLGMDLGEDRDISYGGVDYGSAGEVEQLNSVGFAFTKEIDELFLTGSIDYHDYTYSYFPNNSLIRRVALGFEAAYGINADSSHIAAVQLGLRELKYPSFGLMFKIGVLEFNTVRWTENYGTEKTEILDTRYMFLISFAF